MSEPILIECDGGYLECSCTPNGSKFTDIRKEGDKLFVVCDECGFEHHINSESK